MATGEQLTTFIDILLTTDSSGSFTFTPARTALNSAENVQREAMVDMITAAMPGEVYEPFGEPDDSAGYDFVERLVDEFNSQTYPIWLARLPGTVQAYFITHWLSGVLSRTDLLGSSSTALTALVLTTGSDGVTSTVTGKATFAKSQSWFYMSILAKNLPDAVPMLTSGREAAFATAVYRQLTSGTAPPWFQAMPTDAQSFVLLDYLPNKLSSPMTLDWLEIASPAARSTVTTGPTSTTGPTATSEPTVSAKDQNSPKSGTIAIAILISLLIIALALGFTVGFIRHRRRRRARSLASDLPPLDPEQATRRWSETTFSTAVSPQSPRNQHSFLPPISLTESPARDSTALRRAHSESDMGQVASPDMKAKDLEGVETQSDPAELEARTVPLTKS